jgi:hypothetical protein
VLDGATTAGIDDLVRDYLELGQVSPTSAVITVAPDPPNDAGFGDPVTVTVAIPFDEVSWLPSPMYLGGKTLSATTVMRRESIQQ